MIDLHLHLLPGVDDGALDLAQAVAMCRQAVADGCTTLVATPHQRRDEWETADGTALAARLAELQVAAGAEPRLFLGAEVRIDSDLLADLADANSSAYYGPLALAGSRYLLLELEPDGLGPEPVALALDLRAEGWWPIFAHPELTPAQNLATAQAEAHHPVRLPARIHAVRPANQPTRESPLDPKVIEKSAFASERVSLDPCSASGRRIAL